MTLEYSTPQIVKIHQAPPAFANRGYPYHELDHRQFEVLVYGLYKSEVDARLLRNVDQVQLLQGVRDKGRDCALFGQGASVGLVQCKHSENKQKISWATCAQEIMKFLIYACKEKNLVGVNAEFQYLFACSSGFKDEASTAFPRFKDALLEDNRFDKWFKKILKTNKQLKGLTPEEAKPEFLRLLSIIKVQPILPQDLDLLLSKPQNENIVRLFFELKGSEVDNRPQASEPGISEKSEEQILKLFDSASLFLTTVPDHFESLPSSGIERTEVGEVLEWLYAPLVIDEKNQSYGNVLMLSGSAGYGKSVVMKQLYQQLLNSDVPVLGLKADRLSTTDLPGLAAKLGLDEPIEDLIRKLIESNDQVVVLIDQIDALSQVLSVNRAFIDTFNLLVKKLGQLEGVRIVISCRDYDLNFDTDLKIYSKVVSVKMKLLDPASVSSVCSQIGVTKPLDPFLLELLQIPHHLNVFCKVYRPTLNLGSIHSLHDLYTQLWLDKVLSPLADSGVTGERCQEAMFTLASRMEELGRIALDTRSIPIEYTREFEYMTSGGQLIRAGNDIQFFHQTFYDYCFAKSFVSRGRDVFSFLGKNRQSLHVRLSCRMILTFLRDSDHDQYVSILSSIFTGSFLADWVPKLVPISFTRSGIGTIRVHIQVLCLELLASQNSPTAKETSLAVRLLQSRHRLIFLNSITGEGWIDWMLRFGKLHLPLNPSKQKSIFSKLVDWLNNSRLGKKLLVPTKGTTTDVYDAWRNLLIRNLPKQRLIILKFLVEKEDWPPDDDTVLRALYFLKIWDSQVALDLYDKYVRQSKANGRFRNHLLEDALKYEPKWAIYRFGETIEGVILGIAPPNSEVDFEYEHIHFFEELFKSNVSLAFEFTIKIIRRISELTLSSSDFDDGIERDLAFAFYHYGTSSYSRKYCNLLDILIKNGRELAKEDSPVYRNSVQSLQGSKRETDLTILVHTLPANPSAYSTEIYALFISLQSTGILNARSETASDFRDLLKVAFPFFSDEEKEHVIAFIRTLTASWELPRREAITKFSSYYGFTKLRFLQCLPESLVLADRSLRTSYLELKRRYPDQIVSRPRSGGGVVGPPLNAIVYSKMTQAQWERSFKKFDSTYHGDMSSLRGGMTEHARQFELEVSQRPGHFAALVERLIDDIGYEQEYLIWGLEGLKKGNYEVNRFLILFKKAIVREDLEDHLVRRLVWLAEYLINQQAVDSVVLDWLIDKGLHHPDPEFVEDYEDSLQSGFNSVRGAVAAYLPGLHFLKTERDKIIAAARMMAVDPVVSVRIGLVSRLALLMHLDEEQAIDIFLITTKGEQAVIRKSIWSLQYLSTKNFSKFDSFFKEAFNIEDLHHDLGIVVGSAVLRGDAGSESLFERLLSLSDKAKSVVPELAIHFCTSSKEDQRGKGIKLFRRYIGSKNEGIVNAYSSAFRDLQAVDFKDCHELLKLYASSKLSRHDPHSFFEYLLKVVKMYPKECIELLERFGHYEMRDITRRGYYEDEPVKILLRAYNSLDMATPDDLVWLDRSMKLFDKMLLANQFSATASTALRQIEA